MKLRIFSLVACLLLSTSGALAHNGEEHVIGTVASVTQSSITVETTASKLVTVAIAPETKFVEGQAAAKAGDLKVGERVVIHAKEPSEGNLVADIVEFSAIPAQNGSGQPSAVQSLTGIVSDASCGATHSMKGMSAADCTRMCAKMGRKYALVVGAHVYALRGHEAELQKLAGAKVTVKGNLNGRIISIDSVVAQDRG